MSDTIIKLVPADPNFKPDGDTAQKVLEYLIANVPADDVNFKTYRTPNFSDSGDAMTNITCPLCGKDIDMDWWAETVLKNQNETKFTDLNEEVPCCKKTVSLNDLKYNVFNGGATGGAFGCIEYAILNPQKNISVNVLNDVKDILGCDIKAVTAHY